MPIINSSKSIKYIGVDLNSAISLHECFRQLGLIQQTFIEQLFMPDIVLSNEAIEINIT